MTGWVHDPDDTCEQACCGPTLPVTADVQLELAEALYSEITFPTVGTRWDHANHAAAALLPTVQRLIAEEGKRAAAAAAHEWQGHLTTVLADLLRMTYSVQLDSSTDAARKESERVADAFRARVAEHCRERDNRIRRGRAAALDPAGAASGETGR